MNAVEFHGVGKRFDDWVFRDVDLALPNERTTALVGPSGCGKTTLLQLVNAVQRPDLGVVEVFGEPVPESGLVPFRRRFGYAVQGAGLFPHMTIADNVGLVARLEGWPAEAIRARRRELLDIVGLSEALDGRYPHQLSGWPAAAGRPVSGAHAEAPDAAPRRAVCRRGSDHPSGPLP